MWAAINPTLSQAEHAAEHWQLQAEARDSASLLAACAAAVTGALTCCVHEHWCRIRQAVTAPCSGPDLTFIPADGTTAQGDSNIQRTRWQRDGVSELRLFGLRSAYAPRNPQPLPAPCPNGPQSVCVWSVSVCPRRSDIELRMRLGRRESRAGDVRTKLESRPGERPAPAVGIRGSVLASVDRVELLSAVQPTEFNIA